MNEIYEVDFDWNSWQMTISKKNDPNVKVVIKDIKQSDVLVNQLTDIEAEMYEKIKAAKEEYHRKHDELVGDAILKLTTKE